MDRGNSSDGNEVWTPPESTQDSNYRPEVSRTYSTESVSYTTSSAASSSSQGYTPTTSSPQGQGYSSASSSAQGYSVASSSVQGPGYSEAQFVTDHYQPNNGRIQSVQFSEASYPISVSEGQVYQAPQSSYERISPVDDYREIPSGSENISSYSAMQAEGSQMISGQAVDSSSLQQSSSGYPVHQVVLSSDQRVLTVQRVISPVDCTVSQSALSLSQQENNQEPAQTHTLLSPVTSVPRYPVAQVSSYTSHSEVSTSGGSPLISHAQSDLDRDQENGISSISGSMQEGILRTMTRKVSQDMESISGEPDTTQDDGDDYQVRSYIVEEPSSLEDSEPVLHSTMMATPGPSSHHHHNNADMVLPTPGPSASHHDNNVMVATTGQTMRQAIAAATASVRHSNNDIMDSTMDSSDLSSSMSSSGSHHVMSAISLPVDTTVDRSVDSSVSSGIGHSSMSGLVSMDAIDTDHDKENISDHMSIGIVQEINMSQIRKSNRIAEMENEESSWQKPKYRSRPYNTNELWCEECQMTYDPMCPTHRLQIVPDKIVLSRAWASLPPMLQIFRLNDVNQFSQEPHVGVFAKKSIPKLTQFGPFIGDLVNTRDQLGNVKFLILLERSSGEVMYFETTDENKCNWMMFIRPAENFAEQNMVAYQHGTDIYFSVTKTIEARAELKVWYAPHYAERYGLQLLEITDQDIQAMDELDCKFQCYECSKKFKTSMALQRHLVSHEASTSSSHIATTMEPNTSEVPKGRPLSSLSQSLIKKRSRMFKDYGGETSGYMWKKKSTSIYLNRSLKNYKSTIKKTIQSLYRKKGKESGGNEWVCVHCDLTFDNSNLLNLHTLTHAAENVGLDEVRKLAYGVGENGSLVTTSEGIPQDDSVVSIDSSTLACPVCHAQFTDQRELIDHASEHGTTKRRGPRDRPHKCDKCWKAFHTQEKLQRHMLCHGDEDSKPLQCEQCFKRFMNNSALSCHMKTHSDRKYYECPICHEGFDHTAVMKEHVVEHAKDGVYSCPDCQRQFDDFMALRKHIRSFHTNKEFPCPHCEKVFPRPDKLKLHMLRHSTHREFMCENCGRQFKRKDKLKEHIRRMHSLEREAKNAERNEKPSKKKFVPKVSPSDYHRFIYKCHTCMHGFKRRGMLVNHLAKRHPDVKMETVPELNLPILKTQKDYYCQYCEKVYKSSSKRKAHIIKNHPGADLPMSSRKKNMFTEIPGLPNPTYSQTVGSITTMPHSCEFCHKQYASKAKLTQHQRKKHPDAVPPLPPKPKRESLDVQPQQEPQQSQEAVLQQVVRYDPDTVIAVQHPATQDGQPADLLTQAMSELTQTLQQEYRQTLGEYQIQRVGSGTPTMLQVQTTPVQHPHSTIDLSQLGHALTHVVPQGIAIGTPVQVAVASTPTPVGTITPQGADLQAGTVVPSSQSPSPGTSQQIPQQAQVITSPQTIVVSGAPGQTIPVSLTTAGYLQRAWTNYNQFR